MILIADSGSTKCDWMVVTKDNHRTKTHTMGFNPFFHDTELISEKLMENEYLVKVRKNIDNVFFYGAGCSSVDRNNIVLKALKQVFTDATTIKVDHDLTGAALATANDSPGIACILGTGSNSCQYDGNQITENIPALGYILGDEGSGSYFGKQMLSDWLYNRMPEKLAVEFGKRYEISKESIFESVYNKPHANVFLASFMRFASDHKHHPYFRQMIYQGLAHFISIHVWCYKNFRQVPVHFVGSIAYYFDEELREVARNHRFTVGKIEKRPIDPLGDYHYLKTYAIDESESMHL